MDGSKLYLSILHPSPAASGIMVVDTKTWKIKKEIQGIGPDMQNPGGDLRRQIRCRRVQRFPTAIPPWNVTAPLPRYTPSEPDPYPVTAIDWLPR
jgi:hypothetical protein